MTIIFYFTKAAKQPQISRRAVAKTEAETLNPLFGPDILAAAGRIYAAGESLKGAELNSMPEYQQPKIAAPQKQPIAAGGQAPQRLILPFHGGPGKAISRPRASHGT